MTAKKTTVKPKPLTKVQELERRIENLESAIWQHYSDSDEFFAQLNLLKIYVESQDFNKYVAKNYINSIFTTVIAHQGSMMDYAGLEY